MGEHIVDGEFQSDKYPWCRRGFVPLKLTDEMAQDLLAEYARRRRAVDPEFADDLLTALEGVGFFAKEHVFEPSETETDSPRSFIEVEVIDTEKDDEAIG